MSLIPEVKCARCDRKYSGLRSRCPYCGTRKRTKGKRVSAEDNSLWKMIIGALLLGILIIAVIVLLVTSITGREPAEDDQDQDSGYKADEGVNSVVGNDDDDNGGLDIDIPDITDLTGGDGDDSTGGDTQGSSAVTSLVLQTSWGRDLPAYSGSGDYDYDLTIGVGESLELKCIITPEDTTEKPVWESDDDSIVMVLQSGKLTAVGKGTAKLTVTVGDVSVSSVVRVN